MCASLTRTLQRARGLAAEGEHPRALELLDQALLLDAGDADAHFLRGVVLVALRREGEARRAFAKSIALRPDFAAAVMSALAK